MKYLLILSIISALGCSSDADPERIVPGSDMSVDMPGPNNNEPDASNPDMANPIDMPDMSDPIDMPPTAEACRLPPPIDEGVTYERTLYVAQDGTGDGSEASPFGSIAAAAQVATPGTKILVAEGRYERVQLPSLQGEPGRPIAIEGQGEVFIDGGTGIGLGMSDGAYVVLQGLTIQAGVHGMNLDDGGSYDTPAHHIVLRDITITSAGSGGNNDCIKMSGVDDFWVLDSQIAGCNRGELVDMVGCHRGVIAGNDFGAPIGNGVQAKGGSSDILITGNRFDGIPGRSVNAGGSTGLEFFRPIDAPHEAARIHVISNLIINGGAESGAAIAFVGCDACVFAHNTVIQPQTWIGRILQESTQARFVPSRDGVFSNNIIVFNTADLRTTFNVGGNTAPETFSLERNLWFALDEDENWAGPTIGSGIPAEVDALIQEDPEFRDRDGGDFRLLSTSPAANQARPLNVPLPPDLAGRCFADPASIGAYELEP